MVFEDLLAVRSEGILLLYLKTYSSAQKIRGIGCFQFHGRFIFCRLMETTGYFETSAVI